MDGMGCEELMKFNSLIDGMGCMGRNGWDGMELDGWIEWDDGMGWDALMEWGGWMTLDGWMDRMG